MMMDAGRAGLILCVHTMLEVLKYSPVCPEAAGLTDPTRDGDLKHELTEQLQSRQARNT